MGGCDIITSQCAEIIVVPDPTIDIQPLVTDTICEGGTIADSLTVSYTIGTGVGNVSYQWYDSTGAISGADSAYYTPVTSGLSIGPYYYWAMIEAA